MIGMNTDTDVPFFRVLTCDERMLGVLKNNTPTPVHQIERAKLVQ